MASIRERNGKYMVTWRKDGKQHGKTCKTIVEARTLKRTIERGEKPEAPQQAARSVKAGSVEDFCTVFLSQHNLSDEGRRFYRGAIYHYLIPCFPQPMNKVTAADVRKFLRKLEETKSGAMVRKVRAVGSSMWADAIDEDLVMANPWRGQRIKQHIAKPKVIMTVEVYRQLLDMISPHWRLLVQTLAETGLRWSEAMRLTPGDVIGNTIYVRKSKSRTGVRQIVVSDTLAQRLRKGLPFRNTEGNPVNYDVFRKGVWNPLMMGTGFTIHDLRHAHASWLLQGGADLVTVRDRLGHSSIAITSRYLHTLPDAGDRALAALDRMLAA